LAIYVDDFLLAAGMLLQQKAPSTLHAIHSVLPTPATMGTLNTKYPVSKNKLAKGDAHWDIKKETIWYWLDGVAWTVQLLPDHAGSLLQEVKSILKRQRVPLK
jgi:hypothetical protein